VVVLLVVGVKCEGDTINTILITHLPSPFDFLAHNIPEVRITVRTSNFIMKSCLGEVVDVSNYIVHHGSYKAGPSTITRAFILGQKKRCLTHRTHIDTFVRRVDIFAEKRRFSPAFPCDVVEPRLNFSKIVVTFHDGPHAQYAPMGEECNGNLFSRCSQVEHLINANFLHEVGDV
jgi:hypothetical protein